MRANSLGLLLAAALLCASCSPQKRTVTSKDDFLRALVEVAEGGRDSVCRPQALEERLNITIHELADRSRRLPGGDSIAEYDGEIASGAHSSGGEKISGGTYVKFKSRLTSFCQLAVVLPENSLCDMDSERVQAVMKTRVQYLGDTTHSPGQPIVYIYPSKSGGEVQVSLGSTKTACTDTAAIRYQGEWQ